MVCKVCNDLNAISLYLNEFILVLYSSGTPLGRGEVEDLVNIFAFIQQKPFASMNWKLFSRPKSVGGSTFLSMLHNMLGVLTLRRTHQVVEVELGTLIILITKNFNSINSLSSL